MDSFSRLLNAQLLIHFELDDQLERIRILCDVRPLLKGKFAERLLLYDHLVTPTIDFSVIPVLVAWMGEGLFREALDQDAISFVRYRGGLGYSPGAGGLGNFQAEPGSGTRRRDDRDFLASSRNPSEAIDVWLGTVFPDMGPRIRTKIARSVLKRTLLFDEFPDFDRTVAHETYMDALNSPTLREYFGIRSKDLRALTSIAENQLKVFSPNAWTDQIEFDEADVLLGMAAVNLELSLMKITDATDAVSDPSIERFMIAKAQRTLSTPELAQAFTTILEVNDVPDLATEVASEKLSFEQAWKLRSGASAEIFRRWFHESVATQPERAAQEYIRALSRSSWLNSSPVKTLRLLLTQLPIGFVSNMILGAADSSFVGGTVSGRNPRYLIDDLRRTLPRRSSVSTGANSK